MHKNSTNFGLKSRKGLDTVRSLSASQHAQNPVASNELKIKSIHFEQDTYLSSLVSLAGREASDGVRPLS